MLCSFSPRPRPFCVQRKPPILDSLPSLSLWPPRAMVSAKLHNAKPLFVLWKASHAFIAMGLEQNSEFSLTETTLNCAAEHSRVLLAACPRSSRRNCTRAPHGNENHLTHGPRRPACSDTPSLQVCSVWGAGLDACAQHLGSLTSDGFSASEAFQGPLGHQYWWRFGLIRNFAVFRCQLGSEDECEFLEQGFQASGSKNTATQLPMSGVQPRQSSHLQPIFLEILGWEAADKALAEFSSEAICLLCVLSDARGCAPSDSRSSAISCSAKILD